MLKLPSRVAWSKQSRHKVKDDAKPGYMNQDKMEYKNKQVFIDARKKKTTHVVKSYR
jgi:hypothetical protein